MSTKERRRLELFSRVRDGELTLWKASGLLGLSYRQAKRAFRRYREEGDAGVMHGLRGRRSNRAVDGERKSRVLRLYQEKYDDFGPTLAAEYLASQDGERVAVETLRQWLIGAGLWERRRRGGPAHRKWRERRARLGELVQMDGSHHDWFEGRRGWGVLMVMIDDATSRTYARFFEQETTEAAFETFERYVRQRGLPRALYVDRDSIYRTTRDATVDENLGETPPLTQFGRAMQELDVELILAHSPQAKGRVERRNAVFQDRLVKALRLKGIDDFEAANAFLEQEFLEELNVKFSVPAREKGDLHRRVPRGVKLERVLSFQEQRVVQQDWTIRWRNRWFQLSAAHRRLSLGGRAVLVCEQRDGRIVVLSGKRELAFDELPERPARIAPVQTPPRTTRKHKPAANHPWRNNGKRSTSETVASAARRTDE